MNRWSGKGVFRFLMIGLLAAGGFIASASGAQAHGLGFHIANGTGEHSHQQIGFSWDTAVAEDQPFNYRLNLGYEKFALDRNDGGRDNFSGWILENTFGYRILANNNLRFWGGPQVVTGLYENDFGLGAGLALGINLHLSGVTSLGITAGVRRSDYSSIMGRDHMENIGYLRFDFFLRTPGDRFRGWK